MNICPRCSWVSADYESPCSNCGHTWPKTRPPANVMTTEFECPYCGQGEPMLVGVDGPMVDPELAANSLRYAAAALKFRAIPGDAPPTPETETDRGVAAALEALARDYDRRAVDADRRAVPHG